MVVARPVLCAHDLLVDVRARDRAQAPQQVELAVTDVLGGERPRGLHGDHGQHLEDVVLHHVPASPGFLVVPGAGANALLLGHRELNVINVLRVPERLEHRIGEAQDQQVLHGLLSEVVIDPEDLRFLERTRQDFVDRPGAREVPAHRLLHDDAGDRSLARLGYEPGRLELVDAGGDQARRDRQIEHAVPGYAELGLDLFEPALELRVRLRVGEGARRVEERASVLGPVRDHAREFDALRRLLRLRSQHRSANEHCHDHHGEESGASTGRFRRSWR